MQIWILFWTRQHGNCVGREGGFKKGGSRRDQEWKGKGRTCHQMKYESVITLGSVRSGQYGLCLCDSHGPTWEHQNEYYCQIAIFWLDDGYRVP